MAANSCSRVFLRHLALQTVYSQRHQSSGVLSSRVPKILLTNCGKTSHQNEFTAPPKQQKRKCATSTVCLGGILALLGLDSSEKKEEDPVVYNIKRGILALQRREFVKAESLLHIALHLSQQRVDHKAETYCYSVLANIALEQDDFRKAEKLYLEVMKRRLATGSDTNSNEIVELSLRLAKVYSSCKDDETARQGFEFCIETQLPKIAKIKLHNVDELTKEEIDTALLYGMSLEWYAKYHIERKNYKAAKDLLTKAYHICLAINGQNHPQTLVVHNQLAFVLHYLGEHQQAVQMFEEIVAESDEDSDELATYLCNLGSSYVALGDLERATEICQRARRLAMRRKCPEAVAEAEKCLSKIKEIN